MKVRIEGTQVVLTDFWGHESYLSYEEAAPLVVWLSGRRAERGGAMSDRVTIVEGVPADATPERRTVEVLP